MSRQQSCALLHRSANKANGAKRMNQSWDVAIEASAISDMLGTLNAGGRELLEGVAGLSHPLNPRDPALRHLLGTSAALTQRTKALLALMRRQRGASEDLLAATVLLELFQATGERLEGLIDPDARP